MPHTLLTSTVILREAGRLFHQQAKFIRSINRSYDKQFSNDGAKVGDTINVRDRNEFTVTTGSTLALQNVVETSQALTLSTQKHVGFSFSGKDMSLTIDDFSERYLKPATAALAANVESDIITQARNATPNFIDGDAAAFSFIHPSQARQYLDEKLCPPEDRSLMLSPLHVTKYLTDVKGLFTPGAKLGTQYSDGEVQDAHGFNVFSSTHMAPAHVTGTSPKVTSYTVNGATEAGSSITTQTGTATFLKGDIVTFAGCNDVHPETKADLGRLKQFTLTADSGASALSLKISPPIVVTGAKQNVTTYPTNGGAVVKVGAGANETYSESLAYAKDAFIFGTADLEDPSKYGQWGRTEAMDGISMRIWRSADIINDQFPCRIDVLYGFLVRYAAKMACRMHADG